METKAKWLSIVFLLATILVFAWDHFKMGEPNVAAAKDEIFGIKADTQTIEGKKHLILTFEPKTGYYTEPDKPLSVSLTPPEGVTVEKAKLGWADAKEPKTPNPSVSTVYTGGGEGKMIKAKYRIGICEKTGKKLCHLKMGSIEVPAK